MHRTCMQHVHYMNTNMHTTCDVTRELVTDVNAHREAYMHVTCNMRNILIKQGIYM